MTFVAQAELIGTKILEIDIRAIKQNNLGCIIISFLKLLRYYNGLLLLVLDCDDRGDFVRSLLWDVNYQSTRSFIDFKR